MLEMSGNAEQIARKDSSVSQLPFASFVRIYGPVFAILFEKRS